jgi:hypothetical protein
MRVHLKQIVARFYRFRRSGIPCRAALSLGLGAQALLVALSSSCGASHVDIYLAARDGNLARVEALLKDNPSFQHL